MMFLAVHDVMHQMHNLIDTGNFYVPATTGPGTTKRAFLFFMGIDARSGATEEQIKKYSKPTKGHYVGWGNRTITVEGSRQTGGQWVQRSAINGRQKKEGWKSMNISNYQELNKKQTGRSCVLQLHDLYASQQHMEKVLHMRRG
jgi:hypothetical protein